MTFPDRRYETKAQDVAMMAAENDCVDALQRQLEFANNYVLKSFKLRLELEV
ncbi:hypothetical protein [Nitrososphaera sp.]|uniref:hypothetical protein n=1 Tax=Nitrososphaera sp. TaxID=1971748 RepID=UPI002EDAD726